MDIHQRQVGFRFNSVRTILSLSLFELSRLLNCSHYTLSAVERSIRYPSRDFVGAIIALAAQHNLIVTQSWLMAENHTVLPKSVDPILQEKIMIESHVESCMIYCDDPEHRKAFGHRLFILLENMTFSPLQFAKWSQVSVGTVQQWLSGSSVPKRDAMRFIVKKIHHENIPVSLDWLCKGSGVLEPFQYIAPPAYNNQKSNGVIVQIRIDSARFEPYIARNTKISAYPYPTSLFIANWSWFYLYCYKDEWFPVQLESTLQLDVFHIMSLHNKLSDRIFLKNVSCDTIYPIIYLEKAYPGKLRSVG